MAARAGSCCYCCCWLWWVWCGRARQLRSSRPEVVAVFVAVTQAAGCVGCASNSTGGVLVSTALVHLTCHVDFRSLPTPCLVVWSAPQASRCAARLLAARAACADSGPCVHRRLVGGSGLSSVWNTPFVWMACASSLKACYQVSRAAGQTSCTRIMCWYASLASPRSA